MSGLMTRQGLLDRIPEMKHIFEQADSQRDIVDLLQEGQKGSRVTSYSNTAIQTMEAWKDEELLAFSINLALKARRGINTIVLSPGNLKYSLRPASLAAKYETTSKAGLADKIAYEVFKNEAAVGFILTFDQGKYKLDLLFADKFSSRAEMLEAVGQASEDGEQLDIEPQYQIRFDSL